MQKVQTPEEQTHGSIAKEIKPLPPLPLTGYIPGTEELHGIDKPFDSPWDAADKHYPGGFEAYFHEVICCDKIINK